MAIPKRQQLEAKCAKILETSFINPIVGAAVAERMNQAFESDRHYADEVV